MKHDGWGSRRHERLRSFCRLLDRDAHKSFRKNSDFPVWVYLEALDRDHRQVYEAPSIGMLLCKNCGHDIEEYVLARSL